MAAALAGLHGRLEEVAARLRALGLEVAIDAERLQLRTVVKAPGHAFEILGGAEGARVSRVAPVGGRPLEVAPTFAPLDLRQFRSGAELEDFLVASLPQMEMQPAVTPAPAPASAAPRRLEATPAPRNALTLARLAQVFGEEAMLPPNAMVELVQEFQYAGTRYRFVASPRDGDPLQGAAHRPERRRLVGPLRPVELPGDPRGGGAGAGGDLGGGGGCREGLRWTSAGPPRPSASCRRTCSRAPARSG